MIFIAIVLIIFGAALSSVYPPFRLDPEKAKTRYLVVRIIGVVIVAVATGYLCFVVHGWIAK